MSVLCVILARGGSKGLGRKNLLDVAGRPCVAWTVEDALAAESVSRVVLSSDDGEILGVGRAMGVEAHERSAETAGDAARVDAAAREAVGAVDPGASCGVIVILYGNVPVRPTGLIDRAVRRLVESGADSVQSYAAVGKHHPWWTCRVGEDGRVEPWEGDVLNHGVFRRQDLPAAFVPDGGVIALKRAALFLEIEGVEPGPHAFFGKDRRGVVTGEGEVVDVDGRVDLEIADAVIRERGVDSD